MTTVHGSSSPATSSSSPSSSSITIDIPVVSISYDEKNASIPLSSLLSLSSSSSSSSSFGHQSVSPASTDPATAGTTSSMPASSLPAASDDGNGNDNDGTTSEPTPRRNSNGNINGYGCWQRCRRRVANEPVWYMTRKMWHYSSTNRRNFIIFNILFVVSNMIQFVDPLIIAWLFSVLQYEGITHDNVWKIIGICSCWLWQPLLVLVVHGPARCLERKNAFIMRAAYKKYLIDGVLGLPPNWHTIHHSGDTIDRINKGSEKLFEYAGNTFEVIEAFFRLITSTIAIAYFSPDSVPIVIGSLALASWVALYYDRRLAVMYKENNELENTVTERIFDIISNITTILILRIQKWASADVWRKVQAPLPVYMETVVYNEVKWGINSLIAAAMHASVFIAYLYSSMKKDESVSLGNLQILNGYLILIGQELFRFTYFYGNIMNQKMGVVNSEDIAVNFVSVPSCDPPAAVVSSAQVSPVPSPLPLSSSISLHDIARPRFSRNKRGGYMRVNGTTPNDDDHNHDTDDDTNDNHHDDTNGKPTRSYVPLSSSSSASPLVSFSLVPQSWREMIITNMNFTYPSPDAITDTDNDSNTGTTNTNSTASGSPSASVHESNESDDDNDVNDSYTRAKSKRRAPSSSSSSPSATSAANHSHGGSNESCVPLSSPPLTRISSPLAEHTPVQVFAMAASLPSMDHDTKYESQQSITPVAPSSSSSNVSHVRGVNIHIRRGDRIAFIGESGSGKSTCLKLLRGLYKPDSASVTVDGHLLSCLDDISPHVALIPQDPELFSTTVRENIMMGCNVDDATLEHYTNLSCFSSVVRRLPNQWESSIKEKGVNLSGGEKQRLALARGLLSCAQNKACTMVLCDEPTSSVDSKNEMAIYMNIFREFPNHTVISAIHRLHLLPHFHQIYMFDKGRVIAHGSLQEMLSTCESFRTLWDRYHKTLALTNQLVALRQSSGGTISTTNDNTPLVGDDTSNGDDIATATMADLGIGSPQSPDAV